MNESNSIGGRLAWGEGEGDTAGVASAANADAEESQKRETASEIEST